jgi:hypothetical protein
LRFDNEIYLSFFILYKYSRAKIKYGAIEISFIHFLQTYLNLIVKEHCADLLIIGTAFIISQMNRIVNGGNKTTKVPRENSLGTFHFEASLAEN